MTYEEFLRVADINRRVNSLIRPMSDISQYQRNEWWVMNPSSNKGDCEDYALTKYDRLLRSIRRNRMKIYVVLILAGEYAGQYHAVLIIDDMWCLDNLTDEVLLFSAVPYRLDRIEADLEKFR